MKGGKMKKKELIAKDYFGDNITEDSILFEVEPTFGELEWKPFKKKWKNKKGYVWFARCSNKYEGGLGDCGEGYVLKRNLKRIPKLKETDRKGKTDVDGTSYVVPNDIKIFNTSPNKGENK